ncbi:MAG: MerR family transcriptional regulator [Eubacteriales bacterium]|nr:MerR family transcriptional regulator [Eubacteriales bacterium]
MYTIGQVSKMFHLPVSTLRYYDKEGLFPEIQRDSGIRRFGEAELEALRLIECLKKAGMEIKDIRQFMVWCSQGSSTYALRRDFFLRQKEAAEKELEKMQRVLDMICFKCWYYEQAVQDGNEERLYEMIPDHLPEEIRMLYDHAHEDT